jgi:hypothetical protein
MRPEKKPSLMTCIPYRVTRRGYSGKILRTDHGTVAHFDN